MCGICGTAGFFDQALLLKMTRALVHRGPDSEGFYSDEKISLGVRRLRVIDLTTGDQPIHNEDETVWVVLNGEIYNYRQLKSELRLRGHAFYTNSDTEVIVHLYEEYGKDCVAYLDGMFVFAVWDKAENALLIARDRLGIKPLYYRYHDSRLVFSSELKSLIQDSGFSRNLDPAALAYFFGFLYIPSPLTIMRGIRKLPPAHTLTYKDGCIDIQRYWDLRLSVASNGKQVGFCEYIEKAQEFLSQAVKKRLISDVPLGAFLSGGIDSSAIVAMMRKVSSGPIKTFSIGYAEKYSDFNELDYAERVARQFETEHKTFIVEPDIIELLPKVVWCLDEPFADSSAVLNYLISREAKREVTVALSGIGGDEAFGGYPRYIGARLSFGYRRLPQSLRRALAKAAVFLPESAGSRNWGSWARRFLQGGILGGEEQYIMWMCFFDRNSLFALLSPAIRNELIGFDLMRVHRDFFDRCRGGNYLNRICYVDVQTYLVDDLLFLGDRTSMASSLEVRVPFCDHKLMEFAAAIPCQFKFKRFQLKGLLKAAFKDSLPAAILHKPKQGFMVPLARWLREDLREYVYDTLGKSSFKDTPYFDFGSVQKMLDSHMRGKANFSHQIWALLVFRTWCNLYRAGG